MNDRAKSGFGKRLEEMLVKHDIPKLQVAQAIGDMTGANLHKIISLGRDVRISTFKRIVTALGTFGAIEDSQTELTNKLLWPVD